MAELSQKIVDYVESVSVADLRVMSRTTADGATVSYESMERMINAAKAAKALDESNDDWYGAIKVC